MNTGWKIFQNMIFNVQRHIIDATRFPCNFTGIHYYFELNIVYIFDNFEQIFHQWIHCIVTRCKSWVICLLERCTVCYIIGISKKYFFYWSCWIWSYIIFPVLFLFSCYLEMLWSYAWSMISFVLQMFWNIYFTSLVYLWLLNDCNLLFYVLLDNISLIVSP